MAGGGRVGASRCRPCGLGLISNHANCTALVARAQATKNSSVVNGRHPARTRAITTVGPQKLGWMAPDEVLDCTSEAAGVFFDVGASIVAALNRNLVENLDSMPAPVPLPQQKNRHDRHLR